MSKPTLKMTHGAIGEAMCCYTDGSYKDADIALTEYENSIRADERAKTIDKFVKSLFTNDVIDKSVVRRVAEQMKGENE